MFAVKQTKTETFTTPYSSSYSDSQKFSPRSEVWACITYSFSSSSLSDLSDISSDSLLDSLKQGTFSSSWLFREEFLEMLRDFLIC